MGNMQILCGNIIPQTSKQELCVSLAVPDYIDEKYHKCATREDALEMDLSQDPVLCYVLFPCFGTDRLSNLTVQGSEYKKKQFKISLSRVQYALGRTERTHFIPKYKKC